MFIFDIKQKCYSCSREGMRGWDGNRILLQQQLHHGQSIVGFQVPQQNDIIFKRIPRRAAAEALKRTFE